MQMQSYGWDSDRYLQDIPLALLYHWNLYTFRKIDTYKNFFFKKINSNMISRLLKKKKKKNLQRIYTASIQSKTLEFSS